MTSMTKKNLSMVLSAIFQKYHENFDRLNYGVIEITVREGGLQIIKVHETFKIDDDGDLI